ncbi:hypothetical protein XAC3562_1200122 [Xanthomonas citri pv. citri]|uniref:Uncharacterized protein n=1 Tax=Xanthomonas citri pv. citri TaxID=611301 RepID=A0A0U5FCY1_XANCI|nr:hypothetical protein XAC3608_2030018 [Xanthomonas citri pv. citri]CEG14799.1 hypothetical protein XAC3562_1200122 [Xanthomonas citri pv. citri]
MDYTIDHGRVVLAARNDEAAAGQFSRPQVRRAAAADVHRWNPCESERVHVVLEPLPADTDAVPRALTPAAPLVPRAVGEGAVHVGIRQAACDGDGASHAVTGLALEPGKATASIVNNEWHARSQFEPSLMQWNR